MNENVTIFEHAFTKDSQISSITGSAASYNHGNLAPENADASECEEHETTYNGSVHTQYPTVVVSLSGYR